MGAALGTGALGLAGCGSDQATDKGNEAATDDAGLASTSGKTLKVLCTNESYQALFDVFTKEVGAPVEFVSMSSGEVLSKLKAEGGKPSADLWFGGGIDSFISAADAGLLERVDFDRAQSFAPGFKSDNNDWFSKGATVVGFIANNDILSEIGASVPKSWADLIEPSYKDEIMMSSPAVSGTNYAAVAALLQTMGEDAGWEYLKALNENIPFYTKRGSDPSVRVAAGEAAVGITYIDNTLDDILADSALELVYPEEGMPYIPDGVAAFAGADDVGDAKLFIEWLFSSDDNLKALAEIDKKTTMLLALPDVQGLELDFDASQLMDEDLSLLGSERDDILATWDEVTSGKEVVSDS
jgi:iron(III) transport system substrate-binding protein